jgi:DNA-binding FrmR family transcriptional regulator
MIPSIKKQALTRLNRVSGQIDGLKRMVEREEYCVDIITQTSAVKQALSAIEDIVLQNHLSTHVLHQIKHADEAKAVKEILRIYKLSKRR